MWRRGVAPQASDELRARLKYFLSGASRSSPVSWRWSPSSYLRTALASASTFPSTTCCASSPLTYAFSALSAMLSDTVNIAMTGAAGTDPFLRRARRPRPAARARSSRTAARWAACSKPPATSNNRGGGLDALPLFFCSDPGPSFRACGGLFFGSVAAGFSPPPLPRWSRRVGGFRMTALGVAG